MRVRISKLIFSLRFKISSEVKVKSLRSLPGEVGVVTAEVTKGCSLLVDRAFEVKLLDDGARSKAEVVAHDFDDVSLTAVVLGGAVGVDVD